MIAISVALAMDAFAVAMAAGAILRPLTFRPCFRLAFHFGLFQGMMPVIGWLAGLTIHGFVQSWSRWIALGLLVAIGGRMVHEAFQLEEESEKRSMDPSRGMTMVGLAVATSIDALAVGLTLAMINVQIWVPAMVIGVVACLFTIFGLFLGTKAGDLFGKWVEVAGGGILICIGLKIAFFS
nr:manganese efflux pump MntP family protein [Desulfogranum japonicum]